MPKPCVLIVDDDDGIREAFTNVLREEGFDVVSATNGEEGIAALELHDPSVVLLDLMMPVMNGYDFLRAKKHRDAARPRTERAAVVVMSAVREPVGLNRFDEVVAIERKPCDMDRLMGLVSSHCRRAPATRVA